MESDRVSRVVEILLREPELAWEVTLAMHHTHIAGPWHEDENAWHRLRFRHATLGSPVLMNVASLKQSVPSGTWHWSVMTEEVVRAGRGPITGQSPDIEDAKGRIDAILEASGYSLVGSTV
jgi:hypothetical protein